MKQVMSGPYNGLKYGLSLVAKISLNLPANYLFEASGFLIQLKWNQSASAWFKLSHLLKLVIPTRNNMFSISPRS